MRNRTAGSLKEIGLKITPQRQAILELLEGNKGHPSAEGIYREILKQYPGVSFATVYNTLSKLAESGRIQVLDIDPSRRRFDWCTEPHCHFYCRKCGEVFDIPSRSPLIAGLNEQGGGNLGGHRIDAVQFNLKGVCKDCSITASGRRRPGT